jgi:thioredoxin reductase (NADPH)
MINARVVIIGSGPAGWTAAIYAARAMLEPVMIRGAQPGGQLTITTDVENYPGFADVIQGPWLMEQMEQQAANMGTRIVSDHVSAVELDKWPFRISCESGDVYLAGALIIATGAQARWLGIPSEQAFRGYGVSACATCDGFFYRGKQVAVIGGGDTALEEASYLSGICSKVYLVHRREEFRASKAMQKRVLEKTNIEILTPYKPLEILGEQEGFMRKVTGLQLEHTQNQSQKTVDVDGIFIAIGHTPATEIFKDQILLDEDGYIITRPGTTQTNIPGVFAAGDVQDKLYRQAVTSAASGCMAALEAERYLQENLA